MNEPQTVDDESNDTDNTGDAVELGENESESFAGYDSEIFGPLNFLSTPESDNSGVENLSEDTYDSPEPSPQSTDLGGSTFDPSKHQTDDEGLPTYTKGGLYRKKRGKTNVRTLSTAIALCNFAEIVGHGLSDDVEISKMEKGEKKAIIASIDEYMVTKEVEDLPPGYILMFTISPYIIRQLISVAGKNKVSTFAKFFGRLFKKKSAE